MKISVLGDGAWGTAVASLLADNGHRVTLWCHNEAVVQVITDHQCNRHYLPDVQLSSSIVPTTDMRAAVVDQDWIFEAIPVKFLRAVVEKAKPYSNHNQKWISLSKGIETDTLLFSNTIIDTVLGYVATKAVLSGPSFAYDLVRKQTTGVTLATVDDESGIQLVALLSNTYFHPTLSSDMIGAQVCGALKNVVALIIGMLDAQGYTDNTKIFVLMHSLQEMKSVVQAVGGNPQTVYGFSGLGDLVLTCMGSLSKNRALGKQLGQGCSLDELTMQLGTLPEGINTVVSVNQLAQKLQLPLPLLQGVYRVIFENASLASLLNELTNQPVLWE